MRFEWVEWDEGNLEHATSHGISTREIEQVIGNATHARTRRGTDRVDIVGTTDGGRPVRLVAQIRTGGGIRPITAWEGKR